jgi:protein-L-isoaspartate(D-aspartate) O-methyltransferase
MAGSVAAGPRQIFLARSRSIIVPLGASRRVVLSAIAVAVLAILGSAFLLMSGDKGDQDDSVPGDANESERERDKQEPATEVEPTGNDEYAEDRSRMVKTQIRSRDVRDPDVLTAMNTVPRHLFVPDHQVPYAYEDRPLPIGYGQTISQPYIVAVMTEELNLQPGKSRALEVGTGSGYQAAVLAQICSEVFSVEIIPELAQSAATTLETLGYSNVQVRNSDGYYGWEENAPYDAIIVTCAASHIPPSLIEQLADGGRLVLPLGSPYSWQTLTIIEKSDGETKLTYSFPVVFVPMTGEIEEQESVQE